jgi:hypothetical protein
MRKTLLATTAAVALVAGMSWTAAQGPSPGSEAPKASEAPKKSDRSGQAPTTSETPKKTDRTGQAPATGETPKAGAAPTKADRTGQAPATGETPKAGAGAKSGETPRTGETGPSTTTTNNERANQVRNVTLSSEQKTRVHEVIIKDRSARVDRVDFQIRVGVRVPRTVHVFDVPEQVVTIVPQYRGFRYVIVRDELLIIDPDTLEIVAVVQL